MKNSILTTLFCVALLAGCATPEQIAHNAKNQCLMLGYPETDTRYLECVERGFRGQVQQQNQAADNLATYLILEAIF
jgi:uncharacterized lipoprotein YajG